MSTEILIADYQNSQHCADLIYLLNEYAKDPMGGGAPLSDYSQSNLCAKLAKQTNVFTLLCYVDGKPAAICNCVEGFSTFKAKPLLNIHDMGVVSEFRGKGLSQLLMDKVEQIARAKDCCKVTLEVLEGNEVAKNSYIKFGFTGYELDPEMGKAMFWEKTL
ncbi:GNAT family N-acetyltransferase [Thalassomonas sp. M1454]|uniref:GNAT family N-acetyltransferase n=1 Tax=Thalassomonas sp. M1454 TaxID=2594477 RepID=UPI00117DBA23|nr:GNAT family N-acetyltransferase [Thalassomonas sp. M1454]TRX57028.1 GNAT family N-acetyltransferase [Thalassomonas sp. M1454]